jgi:membrane protease YdiL (CAAX protease family)
MGGANVDAESEDVNGIIGIGATLALLLLAGGLFGLADRKNFAPRWLLTAALLVLVNDVLLTRGYGAIPNLLPDLERNWQGKLLALVGTLTIAVLPAFGWRRVGIKLVQAPGSLRAALPVLLLYCAFFLALAVAFPSEPESGEEIAFQLTMPGLEEELFYRGLLLFALDRAFAGRWRFLGVDWGWGAVLSCMLFGLIHAFGYADGGFAFDSLYMALTALPSFIAVWLRLRTGSLLLPVLIHNFGNSVSMWV